MLFGFAQPAPGVGPADAQILQRLIDLTDAIQFQLGQFNRNSGALLLNICDLLIQFIDECLMRRN